MFNQINTAETSSAIPSKTSKQDTEQDVAEEMRKWVQQPGDLISKCYEDAVNHIESFVERQISCLETTWVERQYVKIVMEMWLRSSLKKAFDYLEKVTDLCTQVSEILQQMKLIHSFEDIGSKLPNESMLRDWCECQYLELILDQKSLFKSSRFAILVPSYFQHFKTSLIDQLFARCRKDLTEDQIKLISALKDFLTKAINRDADSQEIMEEEIGKMEFGKESIEKIFSAIQFYEYDETEKVLQDRFKSINESLTEDSWTSQFKSLIKQTCETFLLPRTEIKIENEDGKIIIFIKGIAVFVSKVIEKMIDLKMKNPDVQEIKIVGLESVHVDCDLESKDWHGMNLGIVTDKIYVDKEVCWDVSGQHRNDQLEGSHSQPGESGGNIHIICEEMINAVKWTIIADGGDGSDGRYDGKAMPHRKWLKEDFMKSFPTMSTLDDSSNEKAIQTVLTTLEDIMPVNTRDYGQEILPGYQGNFFLQGTTKDGGRITVAYYQHKTILGKTQRHTFILSQGSKVGQGGYAGSITIEYLRREDTEMPLDVPFIGKDAQQPTAVMMDVYEASGSVGRTGKPAGDVGFIHAVKCKDKNNEGNYIGFDNDVRLQYNDHKHQKPNTQNPNSYAKLIPLSSFENKPYYASINRLDSSDVSNRLIDKSLFMTEAVKMKAIIRQNLVQHLNQINERKQMTQSIQAMVSQSTEQQSNRLDELIGQIDQKQTKLHHHQGGQQREKVGQDLYSKPSTFAKTNQNLSGRSLSNRQIAGRRFVDLQQGKNTSSPDVTCFDLLPTAGGVDSAFHSILGRMNSAGVYVCADTKRIRKRFADFLRSKENDVNKILDVKRFVLRLNGEDFPVGNAIKKKYLEHRRSNGDERQFRWPEPSDQLLEEYAQFIEAPFNGLELPEVELLVKFFHTNPRLRNYISLIHVYEDQNDSSSLKYKKSFNSSQLLDKQHFVLYKGFGEWQRLEANDNLQQFCTELEIELFQPTKESNYFSTLMDMLIERNHQDLIVSIKKLNPEDGVTPDKLCQLLLEKHFNKLVAPKGGEKNDENIGKQLDQLASDIHLLTQRVVEYNNRNVSPLFYLHIVSKCNEPNEWKYQFLLLEMEERLTQLPSDRHFWRKNMLTNFKNLDDQSLTLLREGLIMEANESGACSSSTMTNILKMLPVKSGSNKNNSERLDRLPNELVSHLPLNDWLYELQRKIWKKKVNQLSSGGLKHEKLETMRKEAVYLLLELEYEKGKQFCYHTIEGEQELPKVVDKLREANRPQRKMTKVNCDAIFESIRNESKQTERDTYQLRVEIKELLKIETKQSDDEKSLKKSIKQLPKSFNCLNFSSDDAIRKKKFLDVYEKVIQLKMKILLRETQRVTILILLKKLSSNVVINCLTQVSTGEGKSLIVAGVAIYLALSGIKVDVVTSNDVLALRDSSLTVADGGLKDIYEYFGVGVTNNCSKSQDDRVKAYNSAVVYGELANFQRDYLLHTFYGLNVRGNRKLDVVIVDEVDCMLLDRGSNTLYLSHNIPGMEMLESLYVFIWERIQTSSPIQLDIIKSQVLYDLYGTITKQDLEKIHAPLKDKPSEKNELWDYLIQTRIIAPHGRLLNKDVDEISKKIDHPELKPQIVFYFRKVIDRERHIRIPEHLLPFVDRHLDTWLTNALRALEFKPDEDYVVDQDRTDTSPDLNPQVIIIDPDTGTDQSTSQWDEALHQFLQLKEGCKLTLQSLKAVFISNEEYIKLYIKLAGVSGTLGSQTEKDYMRKTYASEYFTIPTALPKRFDYKMPKVLKTKDGWISSIISEIRKTVQTERGEKDRSIVIFCRTIKDVNIVYDKLKIKIPHLVANNKVHRYTRDYEQFAFEAKSLDIGHVIIATNLAGRGTDIKISPKLIENGGLHICMTYLPPNERITEQAMGRSGRNGAPGSGILILCQESAVTDRNDNKFWSISKYFSMKSARHQQELQRISRIEEDFKSNQNQSKYLKMFTDHYNNLKIQLKEKGKWTDGEIRVFCDNALDKWALWLDEIENFPKWFEFDHKNDLKTNILDKFQLCESLSDNSWMLPARSVVLAKFLAQKTFRIPTIKKETRARKISASLLNKLIPSKENKLIDSNEEFFYPIAPYYLAFLVIKEGEWQQQKTDLTRMLRSSQTILNKHINMQISFYLRTNQNLSKSHSFLAVEAYKQQKVNIANLFGHYINSIKSLLGSHYCSTSDMRNAIIHGSNEYNQLMKTDFIIQPELNNAETVPNQKDAIQLAAKIHNVNDPASLEEKLSTIFKQLSTLMNEKEIEKKIKTEIQIPFTRKSFWKNMVENKVLKDSEDFIIMDDSECDKEPELNRTEKLTIDFDCKDYVFFSPMPYTAKEMLRQNKIMFREKYVKDIIKVKNFQNYRDKKKTFDFNKIARLDLIKLKQINSKTNKFIEQLKEYDLLSIHIDQAERKGILVELENQKIIDCQGYLASEYNGQEFRYPKCPAYEDDVMVLLTRKFAVEIVIRQWLKSEEDPDFLKAIELLPINPHRNLLADLMAAHVIAGVRVKENTTDIDLKQAIDAIIQNEEERKCLLDYLRSRQALYSADKSPEDFSLDFIGREIRTNKSMHNISTELYIFGLVGSDHHIIYKNEWSFKTASQALIGIAVGCGLMVGGSYLDSSLLGIPSLFGVNFLVSGGTAYLFNAIETLLLRRKSSWTDYGRQSLLNLIGKPDPYEKISTLWKIFKYRKSINQTYSLPISFNVEDTIMKVDQKIRVVATNSNELTRRCRLFGNHLIEKIDKTVDNNLLKMKETFSEIWQSRNHEDIRSLIKEKTEQLNAKWIEKGENWVSEVKETVLLELTDIKILKIDKLMPIIVKHLEDFTLGIRMVHVTLECLKRFRSELEEDFVGLQSPLSLTTYNFDVGMEKRFYKKVVDDLKSELARNVEQIIELLATEMATLIKE